MIAWSLRQSGSVRAKMCEDVPPYLMGERAGSYYVIDGLRFLVASLSALPVCGPMPSSDSEPEEDLHLQRCPCTPNALVTREAEWSAM
jgi:hypothetical protein